LCRATETFFNFAKASIGAGSFALPWAILQVCKRVLFCLVLCCSLSYCRALNGTAHILFIPFGCLTPKSGIVAGPIALLIIGGLSLYTMRLMLECKHKVSVPSLLLLFGHAETLHQDVIRSKRHSLLLALCLSASLFSFTVSFTVSSVEAFSSCLSSAGERAEGTVDGSVILRGRWQSKP
jgi:amino acid permease